MTTKEAFPLQLKRAREARKVTQQELCKLAETPSIAQFETGARLPSAENIVKLAKALKVRTDFLLGVDNAIYWDGITQAQLETLETLLQLWRKQNTNTEVLEEK